MHEVELIKNTRHRYSDGCIYIHFGIYVIVYSRLPNSRRINKNILIKSRYSVNAPKIDFFAATSALSPAIYIDLIRCVSQAVNPAKINTPAIEIMNSSCVEAIKILTIDARIKPNRPITMNDPIADKLRLVV